MTNLTVPLMHTNTANTESMKNMKNVKRPTDRIEIISTLMYALSQARIAELDYIEKNGEPMYCGSAWVRMPANTNFSKVLVELRYAHKSQFGSGIEVWNPGRSSTQSMDIKFAGAFAFAKVCQDYGLNAVAECRAD